MPELLADGVPVRCLVRDRARLAARPWHERVDVHEGDALDRASLAGAFDGVSIVFHLIHAMGSSERGFEDRDRAAARHVAEAAAAAGVERIVYLGGLGDPDADLSPHLASRQETGRVLASAGVPVTEFRAAIVVGSGSISFEMLRYLTERLPVMITPRWVDTRVQPIAVRDVLAYLRAALRVPHDGHRIVEIGGPEVLTYRELMLGYANERGLRRWLIPTPVLSPRLSSYWVNLITPIPASIARPLVEGLRSEVIVRDPEPARAYDVPATPFRLAVRRALDRTAAGGPITRWTEALSAVPRGTPPAEAWRDEEGLRIDRRVRAIDAPPSRVFATIARIGGDEGWYVFDGLWRLRGLLDRLAGGVGLRRGRRDPERLAVGDVLDFWRVESVEPGRHLHLRAEMKLPGRAWLRFDLSPRDDGGTDLAQTAFFEPSGLAGLAYWTATAPVHALLFPALTREIGRRAVAEAGSGDSSAGDAQR